MGVDRSGSTPVTSSDGVPDDTSRDRNELQIFHAEIGDPDAPVVLLVHGFPTSSIDWYDVASLLSGERRVCVVDFPGFGFSDKPKGEKYTVARDSMLLDYYLREIIGVPEGAVVAHDRGDSVALNLAARCDAGESQFTMTHLVLSNGNMFLPLSNLTGFQRRVLHSDTAPAVLEVLTPDALAAGLGATTFTPPRSLDDPSIAALCTDVRAQRRHRGGPRHDPIPHRAIRARTRLAGGAEPLADPDHIDLGIA